MPNKDLRNVTVVKRLAARKEVRTHLRAEMCHENTYAAVGANFCFKTGKLPVKGFAPNSKFETLASRYLEMTLHCCEPTLYVFRSK